MVTYLLPNEVDRVVFEETVLRHLLNHRQTKFWHKEAGGQLFAKFRPGFTLIEQATGPRKTDRRSRTGYRPDPEAEQCEINQMHAAGLHYVGDWHTHPERFPEPSSLDEHSMVDCFSKSTHEADGFLLVIVGTSDLPSCLSVSMATARGVKPLVPITDRLETRHAWGPNGVLSSLPGNTYGTE